MNVAWSIRSATVEDTVTLANIVIEAVKAQGRWVPMSATAEDDWHKNYANWGAEQVEEAQPGNILSVIEEHGQPIGRLRVVRYIVADRGTRADLRCGVTTMTVQSAALRHRLHRNDHHLSRWSPGMFAGPVDRRPARPGSARLRP